MATMGLRSGAATQTPDKFDGDGKYSPLGSRALLYVEGLRSRHAELNDTCDQRFHATHALMPTLELTHQVKPIEMIQSDRKQCHYMHSFSWLNGTEAPVSEPRVHKDKLRTT